MARASFGSVFTLLVVLASTRPARAEIIERVVAVVNDDAIFLSDLRRRAVPYLPRALDAPTEVERMARIEQLYRELLTHLVDETLVEQAARKMHVHVTSEDVERAIRNVQRQSGLDEARFWTAVRGQGFTEPQYRADVRRQLLRLKVLNQRVRGRVNITEEDVRREWEQRRRAARLNIQYHASHIFFALPQTAVATQVAAVRREADQVRAQITDAASFDAAVAEHGGGDLGWLSRGTLHETLENALAQLNVGQISQPVRGPNGFFIFRMIERAQGEGNQGTYEQQRMEIYRGMLDEAMARQERTFLEELRAQAVVSVRL